MLLLQGFGAAFDLGEADLLGVTTDEFRKVELATLECFQGDNLTSKAIGRFALATTTTHLGGYVEDLQVWKVDSGVCFFGVVVSEEARVGKFPSVDVMNDHYSDLVGGMSILDQW